MQLQRAVSKDSQYPRGDLQQAGGIGKDLIGFGADCQQRHLIEGVAACTHILNVAMVAGDNQQHVGGLAERGHHIYEFIQHAQGVAGGFVAARMSSQIG